MKRVTLEEFVDQAVAAMKYRQNWRSFARGYYLGDGGELPFSLNEFLGAFGAKVRAMEKAEGVETEVGR